jgi:hypothetical protein
MSYKWISATLFFLDHEESGEANERMSGHQIPHEYFLRYLSDAFPDEKAASCDTVLLVYLSVISKDSNQFSLVQTKRSRDSSDSWSSCPFTITSFYVDSASFLWVVICFAGITDVFRWLWLLNHDCLKILSRHWSPLNATSELMTLSLIRCIKLIALVWSIFASLADRSPHCWIAWGIECASSSLCRNYGQYNKLMTFLIGERESFSNISSRTLPGIL